MRYIISAIRSDGLECSGTWDVEPSDIAKETRYAFLPFTAKGAVVCTIKGHNPNRCMEHVGERYTFSNKHYELDSFQ